MIKNIILDIGDVLVKTNYNDFLKNKGYDEQTVARIARATYLSPVWKELDRGEWSFGEIVDGFVKNNPEIEKTLRHVFDDMKDFILAYPYAAHWVCGLREKGLKVYCLSNISDKICRDCAKELEFLKYTDGRILSYEEKLIKPDPAIYQLLLKRYDLKADECIFIDDLENNVKAARELGIHGIVFQDRQQAECEIEKIRGNINE